MNKKFEKKLGKSKEPIVKIKNVDFHALSRQIEQDLEKNPKKGVKKKKKERKKHLIPLQKKIKVKYQLQKIQEMKIPT